MAGVRSILVTGANQGECRLGMHTVHQLAKTTGVLVFMGSRKIAAAEEALAKFSPDIDASSTIVPVQLDITDPSSVEKARDFIGKYLQEKSHPVLDPGPSSAGVGSPSSETYTINVLGTAQITAAVRPLLKDGSAILNISSSLGSNALFAHRPSHMPTGFLLYSASKAALNSLTVQWALDEERKGSGIRVVSICPGLNSTNLTNYSGGSDPADGCKVIVKEALAKEGKSAVFLHKDGEYPW
ncbi:hypothetical protein B0H11DRAFT_2230526 [Mycena galericulata]|nr:hypothetical protein B0H11DRAFT_2230526 [Mycena galericulata]